MMNKVLIPFAAMTLGAMSLQASLVLTGIEEVSGGGYGNFDNFLTTSGGGQDTTRAGCTSLVGGGLSVGSCLTQTGVFTGGDEQPAGNPTNTNFNNVFTFAGAADSIRIVLNSAEQGQQALSTITIDELTLTLYNSAGTAVWSSAGIDCGVGVPGCVDIGTGITVTTQSGIGNYGLVFRLDGPQAAALQGAGPGTLGLAARVTGAGGGTDTFLFSQRPGSNDPVVPEPGTWAMLSGGLGVLWVARRRSL